MQRLVFGHEPLNLRPGHLDGGWVYARLEDIFVHLGAVAVSLLDLPEPVIGHDGLLIEGQQPVLREEAVEHVQLPFDLSLSLLDFHKVYYYNF